MTTRLDRQLAATAAEVLPDRVGSDDLRVYRAVPVLIHTSGLGATCAYLLARAKGVADHAFTRAARALLADAMTIAERPVGHDKTALELLDALIEFDDHRYVLAERRAQLFAVWLARIAAARQLTEPEQAPRS